MVVRNGALAIEYIHYWLDQKCGVILALDSRIKKKSRSLGSEGRWFSITMKFTQKIAGQFKKTCVPGSKLLIYIGDGHPTLNRESL